MKKCILIFVIIFMISFSSAQLDVGKQGTKGIDLIPTQPINYSTVNVNNSQFLQSHPASYFYQASNPDAHLNATQIEGKFNSSSWNRSVGNIIPANPNDLVNITNNLTISSGGVDIGKNQEIFSPKLKLIGYSNTVPLFEMGDGATIFFRFFRDATNVFHITSSAPTMEYTGAFTVIGNGLITQYLRVGNGEAIGDTPRLALRGYSTTGVPLQIWGEEGWGVYAKLHYVGGAPNRMRFEYYNVGGVEPFYFDGNYTFTGNIINDLNLGGSVKLDDNKKLYLGDSDDTSITYDGTNTVIKNEVGSGDVIFDLNGGKVNITGGLIQEKGNATINNIYGGMWYHNNTATEISFDVDGTYYTLFMVNATNLNGFSFQGGFGKASNLTAQVGGIYQASYMATGSGVNNHLYRSSVFINGVNQELCGNSHKMTAGGDIITQSGICILRLAVGDKISLRTADIGATGTGNYYSANLNLVRIGN